MRARALFWVLICSLTIGVAAHAGPAGRDEAVQWLLDHRVPGGGWSDPGAATSVRDTVEALRALEAAGLYDSAACADARSWLAANAPRELDDLARRALGLSGSPLQNEADLDVLFELLSRQAELAPPATETNPWVDALSLRALNATTRARLLGRPDWPWMVARVAYTHRGCVQWSGDACVQKGGYGLVCGANGLAEPDLVSTSLSMLALSDPFFENVLVDLPSIRQEAATYLLDAFGADGGAGIGASTVHETCLAVLALDAISALQPARFEAAAAFLRAVQLADGSFLADPYLTALAVQVLNQDVPNLVVWPGLVTVNPRSPVEGDQAMVTVTVLNEGRGAAGSFGVSLYQGDPASGGSVVGTATISGLLAGGQDSVTFTWTAASPAGQYTLYAVVDEAGDVDETSEDDNVGAEAVRTLLARDLQVTAGHIEFTPERPAPGQAVSVRAMIANTGGQALSDVVVRFFDGDPTAGGSQVGADAIVPSLASMEEVFVEQDLGVLADGDHDIYVVADPDDAISEGDETNNIASKTVRVAQRVDLVVIVEGIELSDDEPMDGDRLQIRGRIWNGREMDASNVLVRIFDGDPRAGGAQIGPDHILPLVQGYGSEFTDWVTFETLGLPGTHEYYVWADPEDTIEETNEDNNLAARSVMVRHLQDIAITDYLITPDPVEEGTRAHIRVTITNVGSWLSDAFRVRWYDGDPAAGGTEFWFDPRGGYRILEVGYSIFMSADLETDGRPYDREVFVEVVPDSPTEIDHDNNTIHFTLPMVPTRPDLQVLSKDISFSPPMPVEGEVVQASVIVSNTRNASCPTTEIHLYKGQYPWIEVLTSGTVPALGPFESTVVSLSMDTSGLAGDQSIGFWVDRYILVDEVNNRSNNIDETNLRVHLPAEAAPLSLSATPVGQDAVDLEWTAGPGAAAAGVVGYLVYRDGHLLTNRVDRTTDGTPSASSTYSSYTADRAADKNTSTYWRHQNPPVFPEWFQLEFPETTPAGEVAVWWQACVPDSFGIEVLDGGAWLPVSTTTVQVLSSLTVSRLDLPLGVDGVRVVVNSIPSGCSYFGIKELAVYEPWPIPALSHSDVRIYPGHYTYYVQGVDLAGVRTLRSNEAVAAVGDVTPPGAPQDVIVSSNAALVTVSWIANTEPDLAGYRVLRDGVNVATQRHGCMAYDFQDRVVEEVNDGDPVTAVDVRYYVGAERLLVFELERETWIDRVRLVVDHEPGMVYRFLVEGSLDRVEWEPVVDHSHVDTVGNVDVTLGSTVQVRYLRFTPLFNNGNINVRLAEFEAYSPELAGSNPGRVVKLADSANGTYRFLTVEREYDLGTREARRFHFMNFDTQEDDPMIIEDADTGLVLARYSGDLGEFTTPPLIASRYRVVTQADFDVPATGFYLVGYATVPIHPDPTYSDTEYLEGSYSYGVTAVDQTGNESAMSPAVTVTIQDDVAPASPTGLTSHVESGVIGLSWDANVEPDLAGYNLYRDGAAVPMNGGSLIQDLVFDDRDIVNQVEYFYRISAVDVNGNESPLSEPVFAVASSVDLVVAHTESLPSVAVFPRNPSALDEVQIVALVANVGVEDCARVEVSVFDGDPASGGALIGTALTDGPVTAGGNGVIAMGWPVGPGQEGLHRIFVLVDPADAVRELSEDNNTESIEVEVASSPPLLVHLAGIDATEFPYPKASLWVRDANGSGVYGLSEDNFDVLEDGREVEELTVTADPPPPAGAPKMDVVFLVDSTCNMPYMVHPTMCKTAAEMMGILEGSGVDVDYRIYYAPWGPSKPPPVVNCGDMTPAYVYQSELVAPPNTDLLWTMAVTWASQYYPWRHGATRIAVPITEYGSYWEGSLEEAIEAANANDVTAFPLGLFEYNTYESAVHLAEATGGTFHHYPYALDAVPDIFHRLSAEAAQYAVRFLSPRPERDGTVRTVDTTVSKSGVRGFASGTYQAPRDPMPDLAFIASSLDLKPVSPSAGDTVNLSAVVINEGDGEMPATDVLVRLYDGDPSSGGVQVGGDVLLGDMATGATAVASATFTATSGVHTLYLIVDPDDTVLESIESNNRIDTSLDVPGEQEPELALAPSDIGFSTVPAIEGDPVQISALVHNRGADVSAVRVGFFAGDPLSGGRQVGEATIGSIPTGGAENASVTWIVDEDAGYIDIYAFADPFDEIQEQDESDNLAGATLEVAQRQVLVSVEIDQNPYPMMTDVAVGVRVVNDMTEPWTGTGRAVVEDAFGNQVADLGTFTETELMPVGLNSWHARLPAVMQASGVDLVNATVEAQVNLTQALADAGLAGQELDPGSIRVIEVDSTGEVLGHKPSRFVPSGPAFDQTTNATGAVQWIAEGTTAQGTARSFYIYFDVVSNGPKDPQAVPFVQTGRDVVVIATKETSYFESDLTGAFGPGTESAPGKPRFSTHGVAAADFTGDSLVDVVEGMRYSQIELFVNQGDGTFAPGTVIGAMSGSSITKFDEFAVGDLDLDGDMDFVASQYGFKDIAAFLNDGGGVFTLVRAPDVPVGAYTRGKAICDVDEDWIPDLVVGGYSGPLWVLYGNGDGTFSDPVDSGHSFSNNSIACADFDGDGHTDVVRANVYATTDLPQVLLGNGDGTFADPVDLQGVGYGIERLDIGDFDADGRMDMLGLIWADQAMHFYQRTGPFELIQAGTVWSGYAPNGLAVGPYRPTADLTLGAGEPPPSAGHGFVWNTDVYPAGTYAVRATVSEGADPVAEGVARFDIEPSFDLESTVAVDRRSYGANQPVAISADVEHLAGNALLAGAEQRLSILDPASTEIWTEIRPLPDLMPGQRDSFGTLFDTAAHPPGTFQVRMEIMVGVQVVDSDQTTFETLSCIGEASCLSAEVSASPEEVDTTGILTVAYTLTNAGNVDISGMNCRIVLATPAQGQVLDQSLLVLDLPIGQSLSDQAVFTLTGPPDGTYLTIFQAQYPTGWTEVGYDVFFVITRDADGDGYPADVDCDDNDPLTYPGAPELCDLKDNDCDLLVDEDLGTTTCGLGVCLHTIENCVNGQIQICDPMEGASTEVCDALDNDCDGQTDEELGTTTCGLGTCAHTIDNCINGVEQVCNPMEGATAEVCDLVDNDCDGQTDEELGTTTCGLGACVHTIDNCINGVEQVCDPMEGATAEVCDLVDNDCDGQTDEELGTTTCGLGACVHTVDNCLNGVEQVCDPMEGSTTEVCDLVDNDCDGQTDEELGTTTCGLGACVHTVDNCLNGVEQVCDPMEGSTTEVCDLVDNDCDGQTDEELGTTTCGLGACVHTVDNCINGVEQICDPVEGATAEVCDLVDNDCDGQTDEELGTTTCGLGACEHTVENCVNGVEQICDPMEGSAAEVCDLMDNDCDGQTDEDLGATTCGLGACEHMVENCVNGVVQECDPMEGASDEVCDGIDNDCNGAVDDKDDDGDGFSVCVDDCDDTDPAVNPDAEEIVCDGLDNDCNPETSDGPDQDEDGFSVCAGDCDDTDPAVNPGAEEIPCDGIDNDCDPETIDGPDQDEDGFSVCTGDCDDLDPDVNPDAAEIPCNGKDDDCDPATLDALCPSFVQAVCVDELLVMRNNSLVSSYDFGGSVTGELGEVKSRGDVIMANNATVAGSVISWGDLTMDNHALITGDALVGGNIVLQQHAWIAGDRIELQQEPSPCDDGFDFATAMAWAAEHNDNTRLWSDPEIAPHLTPDGGLDAANNAQITLPGGTYYLAYLELGNNVQVYVAPGETVILFVEDWITFRNNASLHNGSEHPEHLYVLCGAEADAGEEVVVRNNLDLGLYLFAPYADVVLDNNAAIHGGITCRSLVIDNNTEILQPAAQTP